MKHYQTVPPVILYVCLETILGKYFVRRKYFSSNLSQLSQLIAYMNVRLHRLSTRVRLQPQFGFVICSLFLVVCGLRSKDSSLKSESFQSVVPCSSCPRFCGQQVVQLHFVVHSLSFVIRGCRLSEARGNVPEFVVHENVVLLIWQNFQRRRLFLMAFVFILRDRWSFSVDFLPLPPFLPNKILSFVSCICVPYTIARSSSSRVWFFI